MPSRCQPDGKVLVGGNFSTLGGQTRNYIGRLNPDGTLDTAFNPGAGGTVYSLAVQADGKILVGGYFTTLGGQARSSLGRLNADGSLDTAFNPGANNNVYCLPVQADGKILVGGSFSTLGGQTRNNFSRLNADGSLDASFNPGASSYVCSVALQPDGKIVVGGTFTGLGGQTRGAIGRVNADGSLDTSFNPGDGGTVYSLAVQADGKILAGGAFFTLGGQTRNYIGRLNPDGSLDTSFNPGANGAVDSMAVQTDGRIMVAGSFGTLGGQTRAFIGRLNAGGSVDATFNPGAGGSVYALAVQQDGGVLAGGAFTTLGGQGRNHLGRLNNTDPATENLGFDGSTATWLRGGTDVESSRATIDASTNGTDWISLGAVTRILGGWEATGPSLPTNATIRARGFCGGGQYNGSGWFVETSVGPVAITCQPTNVANFTNTVMGVSVVAAGTPPLAYQWYKNGAAIASATNAAFTVQSSAWSDAGSYQVIVSNGFGSITSGVAVLTILSPVLPDGFNPGAGGLSPLVVGSLALQADGKVLVGGNFTSLAGQSCSYLGRLNADGSLDSGFKAGVDTAYVSASTSVNALALLGDGRIIAGGNFSWPGASNNYLRRLNADGSLDRGFNSAADGIVYCLAAQSDGKILVGGAFTVLGGQGHNCIGRLNADGSLDTTFNPGMIGASGVAVYSLAIQADGRILVGGSFYLSSGQARSYLGRLNADGTVDSAFPTGANSIVYSLAVQADGKTLAGGSFTTLGGQTCNYLGRLNADGSLDTSFNPGPNSTVYSLAVQTDGNILVGGAFIKLGGQTCNHLGRLSASGAVDTTFNPGANNYVYAIAVQADGSVLAGGTFTTLGGQTRNYLGRLGNTQPATQSLGFDGATVTWLRGGTGPEVWRTTFEACTNGTDWISLGGGGRIPGGWQETGLSLPPNATIRARGFATSGEYNGSGWFVETSCGAPTITSQPANAENFTNTVMGFSIAAAGTLPFGYQWYFNGAAIPNATNSAYTIPSSSWGDVGSYQVVVTNGFGAVTSAVATLTVLNPPVPDSFNPDPARACMRSRCSRTGRSWRAEPSPHWPDNRVVTLGGSVRTAAWMRALIRAPTIMSIPLWCRPMAEFWWGATSPLWGGRIATTLAGSTAMAAWTTASTRERMALSFRWWCRPMERFSWEATSRSWVGNRATTWAGSMRMAVWTPSSIPVLGALCMLSHCNPMAGSWWAASSTPWAAPIGPTWAGSIPMAAWTPSLSIPGAAPGWALWCYRPMARFWWVAIMARWQHKGLAGSMPMAL